MTVRPSSDVGPPLPPDGPRRMLVASDGSPESDGALEMARHLQRERGGAVEVLAVVEPLPVFDTGFMVALPESSIHEAREEAARERIRERTEELGAEAREWRVEVRSGLAAPTIAERAAQWKADLVLAGLGRHRAVDRILGTETVLQLLHLVHVPVVATPEHVPGVPGTVLVAMDFSGFGYRAARVAAPLLGSGIRVHLAHVYTDAERLPREGGEWRRRYDREVEARLEALAGQLELDGGSAEIHLREGDPADELLSLADELDVDMIVAGSHGHSFMGRLLMGSVSTRLVRGSSRALLVVPPSTSPTEASSDGPVSPPEPEPGEPHPWASLLAGFTERHAGRRVALDLEAPEWGARHSSSNFPLLGVDYDAREERVDIVLGESGSAAPHLRHSIPAPRAVEVVADARGRETGLRVEGPDYAAVITLRQAGARGSGAGEPGGSGQDHETGEED